MLIGFEEEEIQGELFGYYRGLMEHTLSMKINGDDYNQPLLQAEEVYRPCWKEKKS
jgi:hypothetical protein